MKSVLLFLPLFLLVAIPAFGKTYTVQELLAASTSSPGIRKMEAMAAAAKQAVGMEASLMDTMLTYTAKDLGLPALTGADSFQHMLMLSQTFPVAGQNLLRGGAAEAEYRGQASNVVLERLMARRMVLTSLTGIEALAEKRLLAEEELSVMGKMRGIMQVRYTSGKEMLPAVFAAEGEISKMSNMLYMYDSDRTMLLSELAELCGLAVSDLDAPKLGLWSPSAILPQTGELVKSALKFYPGFGTRLAAVEKAGIRETLAALAWVPDVSVGVEYSFKPNPMPDQMLTVQVGVGLPLFSAGAKLSAMEMAGQDRKAALAANDELASNLSNRISRLVAEANSLDASIRNLDASGIALSEQNLRNLLTSLEVGSTDADFLFRAVVNLYSLKSARIDYRLRQLSILFELELYSGQSLAPLNP